MILTKSIDGDAQKLAKLNAISESFGNAFMVASMAFSIGAISLFYDKITKFLNLTIENPSPVETNLFLTFCALAIPCLAGKQATVSHQNKNPRISGYHFISIDLDDTALKSDPHLTDRLKEFLGALKDHELERLFFDSTKEQIQTFLSNPDIDKLKDAVQKSSNPPFHVRASNNNFINLQGPMR